jgi:hypothetical protein
MLKEKSKLYLVAPHHVEHNINQLSKIFIHHTILIFFIVSHQRLLILITNPL